MRATGKVLSAFLVFLSADAALARSHRHSYLLNLPGITAIAYRSYFLNEHLSRRCEIDRYGWDAALQAVTGRIAELKFIPNEAYEAHLDALRADYEGLAQSELSADDAMQAFHRARQELADYSSMPKLVLSVTSVAVGKECIGWLHAVLELNNVTPVKRIWYQSRFFVYPSRTAGKIPWHHARLLSMANENYAESVFQLAESAIRSLVDDWTEAQTIPGDDMIP
jgi:hypothetical protein